MKLLPACMQARVESFLAVKAKPSRRTSARSKKTQQTSSTAWPLESPAPYDLAYAGFVWKPTTASPDNVQCFACSCQLDGWEASDVPAYEHLTHSPDCGFAINICIRLRNGDPERAEKDPMSEPILNARTATFGDMWPLDVNAGFPSVQQMAEAGWYYDPSPDLLDGVTCAYCSLSLDSWDAGDNPFDEHQRRSPDCLFFTLKELYHPSSIPFTETSKKSKGKRASTRSSTASTKVKKAPAKAKATKATSTRAKKATKDESEPIEHVEESRPIRPIRAAKRPSEASVQSTSTTRQKRGTKRISNDSVQSAAATRPKRGTKRASEQSVQSALPTQPKRGVKRQSEDVPVEVYESPESPKRMRFSSISSIRPESVFESTPRNIMQTPEQQTPERRTPEQTKKWQPTNIDEFFDQKDAIALISGVRVDAGLDKENVGTDAVEAVLAGLTSPEKNMTVEEWVLYNAKRGEEKLRAECERQIAAFEAEGRRALAALAAF